MIGAIIALSFGTFDFIGNYNVPIHEMGYLPASAYLIITTIAIIRHQLMDIQIVIRKSLIYSLLVACITVLFLICVLLSEWLFSQALHRPQVTDSIITASLIAIIFIPLKNRIQDLVDRWFFKATPFEMALQNEQLRQEISQTEKFKIISTLASGMAHEIKNPLTPIKTFSEELPSRLNDKEFLLKFSRIINKEVDRIDGLVQELLSFSKPSSLQFKETNVTQLIEQTLELLKNPITNHKIKVELVNANDICLIIDAAQIKQALINIFLNAIDAMPNGGALSIKCHSKTIHSHSSESGNQAQCIIEISDTGVGIDPKDLPHIFDPFFTKKEKGTGLGLAITQGIIEKHGGKIKVQSKRDKGTTFTISLIQETHAS